MTSMTSQQEPFLLGGGVFHENRDHRGRFRAYLPLTVTIGDASYRGMSFTMDGFDIAGPEAGSQENFADPRVSRDQPCLLRISLYGFVCEISAKARFKGTSIMNDGEVLHFIFTQIDVPNRTALQRVIRSYMSGYVATPGDLTEANDPPTVTAHEAVDPVVAKAGWRRPSNLLGMAVSLMVLAAAGTLLGRSAYDRFFIIQPAVATVSAPEVNLAVPVLGQVTVQLGLAGQMATRDQALFTVAQPALDADIADAQALSTYLAARAADPSIGPKGKAGEATQGAVDSLSQPVVAIPGADTAEPALVEVPAKTSAGSPSPDELEADLAVGRLKALELRKSGLTGYSPCDCRIAWIAENGSWLQQGDHAATLVRTGAADVRVEALLPIETARTLVPGQTATIRLGASGEAIPARIERVLLDPKAEPRFGLPEDALSAGENAAVLLTTDVALPPEALGTPVDVRIDRQFRLFGSAEAEANP